MNIKFYAIFMLFLITVACTKTEVVPNPTISIFASPTDFGSITPKSTSAILISQVGAGTVSYTATSSNPWVVLSKQAGTIKGTNDTLILSVDSTKLVNGNNNAILTITPTLNGKIGVSLSVSMKGNYAKITYVQGHTLTTNETWDGNISLNGDIVIPAGQTLTVNAGTNVKIVGGAIKAGLYDGGLYPGSVDFSVFGKLIVNGTPALPVNIYSSNSKNWGVIVFSGSGTSNIQYASINNADYGIYLFSSNTSTTHLFKNIYFSNCSTAFSKSGVNTVALSKLTFRDNDQNIAILGPGKSTLTSKTTITNSDLMLADGAPGVSLYVAGTYNIVNVSNSNLITSGSDNNNVFISKNGSNNVVTANNCFGINDFYNPDSTSNRFNQTNIASGVLTGTGCGFTPNLAVFSIPKTLRQEGANGDKKDRELQFLEKRRVMVNRFDNRQN